MSELNECPFCHVSWVGDPIPQEYIDEGHYAEGSHWKREIAIYDIDQDRTVAWKCPDCQNETRRI